MESISLELIKMIPSFLWFLFTVVLVALLYRPIKENILPRLASFEAGGVKFSFVRESIDAAIKLADELGAANNQKSDQWNIAIPSDAALKAENRVKANLKVLKNVFILWVDDHPEFNLNERKMFRQLGAEIDTATNSEQAMSMLGNAEYDLIFSDIARGDDSHAGLKFVDDLRKTNNEIKLIFYIGRLDSPSVPLGAFGITNRPNELLHLTLDILEREKY